MVKAATQSVDVRELLKAGAHFGHKPSHWNPAMKPYIHSQRGGIYIIDLIQTAEKLEAALHFLQEVTSSGKDVLFVGTKRHLQPVVKAAAEAAGMPYVTQHWFGGMLTNFETIHGRVKQLASLEEMRESGELAEGRSKRERGELDEEIAKLNESFGGIKALESLPGALYIVDVVTERIAVKEADRLNIPVVGIVDTNGDPTTVEYPIPANDDAVSAVTLMSQAAAQAVAAGVSERKAPVATDHEAQVRLPKAEKPKVSPAAAAKPKAKPAEKKVHPPKLAAGKMDNKAE